MKETLVEALISLLKVKTLVTFGIIGTVIYLAVKGSIEAKDVMLIAGIIITYFFTKDKKTE
jgi:hypothetical protein